MSALPIARLLASAATTSFLIVGLPAVAPAVPNTWTDAGVMITPREHHTATVLSACQVLIAGGTHGTDRGVQPSNLLYDNGPWRAAAGMISAREFHTATRLPSRLVLVAGGLDPNGAPLSSTELDDPSGNLGTGVFSGTGAMGTARAHHTATLLTNGKVLVAGGTGAEGSPLASAELYDPSSGTWSPTGSLSTARTDHSTTLLSDGRVLVAGGAGLLLQPLASAELYDPVTGTWSTTGSMRTARTLHTATLLADGKVLVAGGAGIGPILQPLNSAELYDPSSTTWSFTGSMGTPRKLHTATSLTTTLVLVAGGENTTGPLASAELFNLSTGTWIQTGNMLEPRSAHTASPLASFGACGSINVDGPPDRVLAAGGHNANGVLASAELYQISTGTWRATSAMSTPRWFPSATRLRNGKVLVGGGTTGQDRGGLASAVLFDPVTGAWSATGSMTTSRSAGHTATLLPSGKVFVAGGFGPEGTRLPSAELYDPASGKWSPTGNMLFAREGHTATLLLDGKVLVAGGSGSGSGGSAEIYDPATGLWTATGSMLSARAHHTATRLADGRVLVAGGDSDGRLAELYDPATGTWTATGRMLTPRLLHTATLLSNGKVFVAGGAFGFSHQSTEVYDPATGTWAGGCLMSIARDDHTATLVPGGKVLLAGGHNQTGARAESDLYDPVSNSCNLAGRMRSARFGHATALLISGSPKLNGWVLTAGGVDDMSSTLSTAELFDPGVVPSADLGIVKTDSQDPAFTGRNLTYTVTVTNDGPDAAGGVAVTDTLPPSVSFVSATPSQGTCSQSGGTVTCTLEGMEWRDTATVDIVVTPRSAGRITNAASVTASTSDPIALNNSDSEETAVCRRTSRRASVPCG